MKESALDHIKELGLNYVYGNGEYDVTVPDIDYDPNNSPIDPDGIRTHNLLRDRQMI